MDSKRCFTPAGGSLGKGTWVRNLTPEKATPMSNLTRLFYSLHGILSLFDFIIDLLHNEISALL